MNVRAEPIARSAGVKGVKVAYWEWRADPGNNEAPLLFAHATGFHSRVFDAIIEHFPGRRVISVDLHGHGRSEGGPIDHWGTVIGEVAGLLDQLRIRRAVGVGHSMGAHILAQCAADAPHAFSRLILFDPVIMEPDRYTAKGAASMASAPHPAIRRKRDFASIEAMMERFRSREPYALFEARVFEDYCRFGLRRKPDGQSYELACSPEMEASIYSSSLSNSGIHEAVKRIEAPTLVVRAKRTEAMDFKGSPTWPMLADQIPKGTDLPRPDRTHFHPFEDPADAAAIISEAIAG
ncbi:MAG: alpha/beta hydrolase [Erythrobacter sp.]|uniref:alpha/beta fold hydrolase n=1 Tax=Erythrobacter sp. TaxID=1042 RepID=UPI0026130467|nr:alpha/beta hydrolase [Erythrobacter sp.]MDJ0979125.1 alpha/beta hydrolase [Erythrobacter sp.]